METKAIRKYEAPGVELVEQAKSLTITDDESRTAASEFSANTRKAVKLIEEEFRPDIDAAHKLHKDLLYRLKRLCEPFKKAQAVVDGKIREDYLERERVRKAEEEKARKEAERERREQEAALQKEAEEAIARGDVEEAEALLDSEVRVDPVVPVPGVRKSVRSDAGMTTMREDIKVEVVDKKAVITAVMDGKLPDLVLDVNVGNAKRYFKASGIMEMQGFRITEDVVVSGRVK